MLKKTITFMDYDGLKRTEEFCFNINKAEAAELELSIPGGFKKALETAAQKIDGPKLMIFFKKIILTAYGTKSADGRRFIKSEELRDDFEQCPAYEILFMELATDPNAAKYFVEHVFPQDDGNIVQLSV